MTWKSPSRKSREELIDKCGMSCFLKPLELKFPICNPNCSVNREAIEAAYKRAREWNYTGVAEKARRLQNEGGRK